jgi:hypothetical protein
MSEYLKIACVILESTPHRCKFVASDRRKACQPFHCSGPSSFSARAGRITLLTRFARQGLRLEELREDDTGYGEFLGNKFQTKCECVPDYVHHHRRCRPRNPLEKRPDVAALVKATEGKIVRL